jgi:hypothetical protein
MASVVSAGAADLTVNARVDGQTPDTAGRRRTLLLAFIAVAFFAAYWMTFPRDLGQRPVFNSPRESIGYYLTERFLDGHGFSAPLLHFEELPRDTAIALTPRDAAQVDGNVVPRDFAGTLLLHAAVMFVHPALALILGPLFALLGAWALMRITEDLFGVTAGYVAFVTWLAFPPLWINGSFIFSSDMPALAFLLLGAKSFVEHWKQPSWRCVACMAVFFSASVLFRYPNVALVAPFALALLAGRKVSLRQAVTGIAIASPFAVGLLSLNVMVYGGPLTTGFHLGAELLAETANYSRESFFKYRPEVLLRYVRTYGTQPIIALPVVLSISSAAFAAGRLREAPRVMAWIALVSGIVTILYYGQQDAWGFKAPQASASFLRYMLPAFALLFIFGSWPMSRAIARWGDGMYILPLALVVASAAWVIRAPGGVQDMHEVVDRSTILQRQVLRATETDAVVAVRIMDKVIFPQRQTLTLTYAMQNEQPFPKGKLETWDYVAQPQRFAEIAGEMQAAGISFYLLHDSRVGDIAPYQAALSEQGLYLRRLPGVTVGVLYKVSRLRSDGEVR